jgi:hypothetical protein
MATEKENESYLELYDVAKEEVVAKAPLAKVRFIPRSGERIFIALQGSGDWKSRRNTFVPGLRLSSYRLQLFPRSLFFALDIRYSFSSSLPCKSDFGLICRSSE